MLVSLLGFFVALVNRAVDPEKKFLPDGSVSWALMSLTAVMAITAAMTGGIRVRSLGSDVFGGKKYFYIWAAIAGYFALASRRIDASQSGLCVAAFFLSGMTSLVSNLAYTGGTKLYWLFDLFPPDYAMPQAAGTDTPFGGILRIEGTVWACLGILCLLLARHGLRGLLDLTKPWRFLLLAAVFVGGLLSGFRSFVVLFALVLAAAFYLEGLHRTRVFPILIAAGAVAGALLLPNVQKLPLSAQRALSFLPVEVDPRVRSDADYSMEWRLEMWKALLPEVPKHLLKGKGYAVNPADLYLSRENEVRKFSTSTETSILAADYHNGPLSLLIPFGIWGACGFLWFLIASGWVLYQNYRFGDSSLRRTNTALLACFAARAVSFLLFSGSLDVDMFVFTGLVGLGVSLNGGVRRAAKGEEQPAAVGTGFST
jgi:hypothetical protein